MIPVIAIRPEPGCSATVAAARAVGLAARGFPLFAVRAVAWEPPEGPFDALLAGSANAFRHGGAGLSTWRDLPVLAVGAATAAAAREAGFAVARTGGGSLQDLLESLAPAPQRLLRLAGADRVELAPPPQIVLVERTVYASEPVPMPAALAGLLTEPAVVLLHSGIAAAHFAAECDRLAIDCSRLRLAALAPRVAEAAGEGWHQVASAAAPDDGALLALARRMCQ